MAFCQNFVSDNIITNIKEVKWDTGLIYLDSIQIVNFLQQDSINESYSKNLKSFYKKRNDEFAWMNNTGIKEYARNFINLLNHEEKKIKNDSLFYHDQIHTLYNLLSEDGYQFNGKDSLVIQLELLLTINFFDYAKRNWGGIDKEEARKVSWFMDKKKLNYELLLDTLLKNDAHTIFSF